MAVVSSAPPPATPPLKSLARNFHFAFPWAALRHTYSSLLLTILTEPGANPLVTSSDAVGTTVASKSTDGNELIFWNSRRTSSKVSTLVRRLNMLHRSIIQNRLAFESDVFHQPGGSIGVAKFQE